MGFPFQPNCARRAVWRVILQYNATLCVTLCYPHHLLGQLLFALPHQLTTVKSLKRYLFRRVFARISFAARFNALRHSANILNHITKCLRNLMYTINKLRIRCVSQCFRPHVATPGISHFNPIEHIVKCESHSNPIEHCVRHYRCDPHHLVGQLLFASSHSLTSVRSSIRKHLVSFHVVKNDFNIPDSEKETVCLWCSA